MKKTSNHKMTLKCVHKLATDLMFNLNDEQCKKILLEFKAIRNQMMIVQEIDTTNVIPLDYPFEITNTYLRSDIAEDMLTTKDVLQTAPATSENYIIINKVVGNEN